MPSPIAHALGGIVAGWPAAPDRRWRGVLVLAVVAIAPDLDLLVGDHRGISHSLGAAAIAGTLAWAATRRPRWGLVVALAWASHVLLDWLSNDTRAPIGVMALWPLSEDYYKSRIEVFGAISRRYWLAEFWLGNIRSVLLEVIVLGPLAALALYWRRIR